MQAQQVEAEAEQAKAAPVGIVKPPGEEEAEEEAEDQNADEGTNDGTTTAAENEEPPPEIGSGVGGAAQEEPETGEVEAPPEEPEDAEERQNDQ